MHLCVSLRNTPRMTLLPDYKDIRFSPKSNLFIKTQYMDKKEATFSVLYVIVMYASIRRFIYDLFFIIYRGK